MTKHILVIAQYFYPEQFRINDICIEWVKRGYKVTVVTGIPNYPQGKFYDGYGLFARRRDTHHGVGIIRLPLIPRGNSSMMLILNYISFVVSGFVWSVFAKTRADCVFIYEVSPMSQALPGVWYAAKSRVPCYLYVTDLWPDNVEILAGITNKRVLNVIGRMVDYIYSKCTMVFTSSKGFMQAIADRGVDKDKIEFWPQYAEDFYQPIANSVAKAPEIPRDGKLNIVFAGNIGYAQGLEILPSVARRLKESGAKVRFNMIGDGRFKNILEDRIKQENVAEFFNFIDKQPAIRIPDFMAIGDAALISLAKNKVFSKTLPAKTQSCFACGVPIIVAADGELPDIVQQARAGLCSDAGDVEGLVANILLMASLTEAERIEMANNALKYYRDNFDKEKLLSRMDYWFA